MNDIGHAVGKLVFSVPFDVNSSFVPAMKMYQQPGLHFVYHCGIAMTDILSPDAVSLSNFATLM